MATTQNTYTGNGSTTNYSFTFPYLETTDIKVSVNGVDTTAYTLANATTVSFNSAPANGAAIRIYRATDDASIAATFYPGSAIRSQDLNDNFTQILYYSQDTRTFAENTDAAAIQATANTALTNSNIAVTTANSAVTTANAASTTANGIASTANTALTNANNAVTTANAALPKSGGTMTGTIDFAIGQTITGYAPTASPTLTGAIYANGSYRGNVTAVAALNIDCSLGNTFTKTISSNSTFTVSNVPASRSYAFTLELTHTSGTITWFSGVVWPGGTAPTLTTGKVHLFMFFTDDSGTTWRASSLINY